MMAGMASRHRYSMASWSPSQSEPFTVSYMCQRQSSSPMLPSAADMPPCAATVWLRVGNTLVKQAVDSPASAKPNVARKPAPPAPTRSTSYICSMNLYSFISLSRPERDAKDGKYARAAKEHIQESQQH